MEELEERVRRYVEIEEKALSRIKVIAPEDSYLEGLARDSLEMINNYFNDAKHFLEKGDLLNAFAALNYSYGWIDSGARLGIFDTSGDHKLFTLYR